MTTDQTTAPEGLPRGKTADADGWIVEYYVVEDRTIPDGRRVKHYPVSGPHGTADEVKNVRARLVADDPDRYGEAYCIKTATDPDFYGEGGRHA